MAVTIDVQPAVVINHSVYRPIEFEVSSDRQSTIVKSVTGVVTDGGYAKYTIGTHGVLVGDIVTGSGFSEATYNVRQEVTGITGTTITTDVAYTANDTGTITRTNDNFKIKNEIIISSVIGTKYSYYDASLSVPGFKVDVSNILQTQLTFFNGTFGVFGITQPRVVCNKTFTVKFTEVYDDKNGLTKEGDNITSGNKEAVQSTLQHQEAQDMSAFELTAATGSTIRFLTNAPEMIKIAIGEEFQLSFLTAVAGVLNLKFAYEKFDLNGVSGGVNYVGPAEACASDGILSVNSNLFGATESRVDVWMTNNSNQQLGEKISFKVLQKCVKDPIRFYWLNRLGGQDSWTFSGGIEERIKVKRNFFEEDLVSGFAVSDRGTTQLGSSIQLTKTAYTEYVTEAEARWLGELFTSPQVFIHNGTDYIPVIVRNSTPLIGDFKQIKINYTEPDIIVQEN